MKLDNQSLINEFFEKERFNFPELSYEQFRDIITGPWRHLKTIMEEGNLEEVRIKYFGNFLVHVGKAKAELQKIKKKFEENTINHKEYFRIKVMIEKFLSKNESKD